jgi:PKD repeat protein
MLFAAFLLTGVLRTAFAFVPDPVPGSSGGPDLFTMVVFGRVYDDSTGSPIRQHQVLVTIDSISYQKHCITDHDGFYRDSIPGVAPGMLIRISTYDCEMMLHSQSVLSVPVPVTVNFEICGPTITPCKAEFYAEIDSSTSLTNTFRFFDLSEPMPDQYAWDFGDGNFSSEKNPSHRYLSPGRYTVCLIITRTDTTGICTDSVCRSVQTPQYYDLGGHVYAGNMPINNPVSTGDTGIIFMYRMTQGQIIPFDTTKFAYLGYYAFPDMLPGKYLLRAQLTPGSNHYSGYFPTYLSEALTWNNSQLVNLEDGNLFMADIHMVATKDILAGPAAIRGTVEQGGTTSAKMDFSFAEVILFDANMEPVRVALSDQAAAFEFKQLPYGAYFLYAEIPGKYSRLTPVWLDALNPSADSVSVFIFGHDVTGLNDLNPGTGITAGNPVPNPASDIARLSILSDREILIRASIFSSSGMSSGSLSMHITAGCSSLVIPVGHLPQGLYYMIIMTSDGNVIAIKKLLKK